MEKSNVERFEMIMCLITHVNTLIRLSKLNHTKNIIIEVKNIAIQNIILMTLAIV
jgi:hypothetical protein